MYCPNGHANEEGAAFCSACGVALAGSDASNRRGVGARPGLLLCALLLLIGAPAAGAYAWHYFQSKPANGSVNASTGLINGNGDACMLGLVGANTEVQVLNASSSECQSLAQQLSGRESVWKIGVPPLADPVTFCSYTSGNETANVIDVRSAMGVYAGEICSGFFKSGWTANSDLTNPSAVSQSGGGAIAVYPNCGTPSSRPARITIACGDGNEYIDSIQWTRWDPTGAVGTGTLHLNACDPSCYNGTWTTTPNTAIVLSGVVSSAVGPEFSKIQLAGAAVRPAN